MISNDTIVAISSATGAGARMIVRLAGVRAGEIARGLCPGSELSSGFAATAVLHLRGMRVPLIVYAFAAGRSYTADELVEFHVPGNPMLCRLLLAECLRLGARGAEPGEFTARA